MSLPFTEEQEMFRKSVRDFVDREVAALRRVWRKWSRLLAHSRARPGADEERSSGDPR
ncbi:MAG: acyl-CoA dehydrogenase family protein [Deltaproteobacteria bacterium]|nr:acyl-CoA dehydrogenase family protein [Deltaproteobacteria bacterium]